MNRRTFLLVAGGTTAALAGCTAPTENPTETPTNTPNLPTDDPGTGTSLPFTVTSTDDTFPDDLEFDVTVENDDLPDGPPAFTITLTNTGDTAYRFAGRRNALYIGNADRVEIGGTEVSFLLIPTGFFEESDADYERNGAVWTTTSGYFQTQELQIGTLEAGESTSATLYLLQNQDGTAQEYPPELTFESQFTLGRQDPLRDGQQVTSEFTITFTSETDPAA